MIFGDRCFGFTEKAFEAIGHSGFCWFLGGGRGVVCMCFVCVCWGGGGLMVWGVFYLLLVLNVKGLWSPHGSRSVNCTTSTTCISRVLHSCFLSPIIGFIYLFFQMADQHL